MSWPACLQSLDLGVVFNQNLENVKWPADLQSLTIVIFTADRADDAVDDVVSLLSRVVLPSALRKLVVGDMLLMC